MSPRSVVFRLADGWEGIKFGLLYLQCILGYAVTFWLALRLKEKLPLWLECLVFPICFVVYEFLASVFPEGFPLFTGVTQVGNIYFLQSVSIFGPWGITFLLYLSNYLIFKAGFVWWCGWVWGDADQRQRRLGLQLLLILLVVWSLNYAYGWVRVENGKRMNDVKRPTAKICLVQPNLNFADSILSGSMDYFYNRGLRRLVYLTQPDKDCDLVIWPELALLRSIVQTPSRVFDQFAASLHCPLLFGSSYYNYQQGGMQNSIIVLSELGLVRDRYVKVKLFPKFEGKNYTKGGELRPLRVSPKLPAVGGMLCFESLLPQMARELRREGAQFLVVLANDVWFGDTAWPWLHLGYMVFRAIENGGYGIHLGNLGPSVIFSPYGEAMTQIPFGKMACANVEIGILPQPTLYLRFGDWFAYLCIFGVVVIVGYRLVRGAKFGKGG